MSKTVSKTAAPLSGGRMIKLKGRVASLAPSLLLGTVSVSALTLESAHAETLNTARMTSLVSAVDEDHTISQDGSIALDPMNERALVEINVTQYNQTIRNDGTLTGANADRRTRVGIGVNGLLTGTVSNSGSVALSSTAIDYGDYRGIDLSDIQGAVTNSGTIGISVDATSDVQATGIHGGSLSGSITNSGDIAITVDGSSAKAYGINTRATSGTVENTGTIVVKADGTGSSATGYGVRMIGLSGTFRNSGNIDVTASAGSEGSAYGVIAYDVSGDLENSGTVRVSATGDTNPNAYGVDFADLASAGTIKNGGTIEVQATGAGASSVSAMGIIGQTVNGSLGNTGTIAVDASGGSWATAEGVSLLTVAGAVTNSGTITARSEGSSSGYAGGISIRSISGSLSNSGTVAVVATGSRNAYATGLFNNTLDSGASLQNSGTIAVTADAMGSSATATGIRSMIVGGTLGNSGTVQVTANGAGFANAEAISSFIVDIDGQLRNTGDLQVAALSQNSAASAAGIKLGGLAGTAENSGTIDVAARGTDARALGIIAGSTEGGPFEVMVGQMRNSGPINVQANGISNAVAYGMRAGTVEGTIENLGTIDVTATSANGGLVTGMDFRQVDAGGTVRNSGDITVLADYSDVTSYYAAGIGGGQMDGTMINSGTIRVTSTTAAAVAAEAAFISGIAAYDVAGALTHDGSIDMTNAGGIGSQAYGIFANILSGTLNVNGDVAARGADNTYAIYAGGGSGTLNINTTARVDGMIRVEDHNVNLTHSGASRVYKFEDANTAAGTFATNVTIDNGAWFVSDAGRAAPVYASVIGEDFAANSLLSFQTGALANGLSSELAKVPNEIVSRNAWGYDDSDATFRTFVRLGFSQSEGTSIAGAEHSNLGFLTTGLIATTGETRYGVGLSMASGISSQAVNSTDTNGIFLSAEVARDFGFAELSFGLGIGQFDHVNHRSIGGSPDAIGEFGSTLKTAHIGISRSIQLSDEAMLTPRASFRKSVQDLEGYTEQGSLANATLGDRKVEFQEAKLGVSLTNAFGNGTFGISLDAIQRSMRSPTLVDVSTFGSTASLTAGGSLDETFGQFAFEYSTPLGKNDLLKIGASSNVGSSSQVQTYSAEYVWEF